MSREGLQYGAYVDRPIVKLRTVEELHEQYLENVKPYWTVKRKCFAICTTVTIVVLCVAAFVLPVIEVEIKSDHVCPTIEEPTPDWEPIYGEGHSGYHQWTCGNNTFDLLIDGDSVKLGQKIFSCKEIGLLKGLNFYNT